MQVRLTDPAVIADPYPMYRAVRECGPLVWVESEQAMTSGWWVTRHADALQILKDRRLSRKVNRAGVLPPELAAKLEPLLKMNARSMLRLDPPDHTRLRGLVNKAFTPQVVEQLRPNIQAVADQLIGGFAGKGKVDLISEFAYPLPVMVIAALLGVPLNDLHAFRQWSSAIARTVDLNFAVEELFAAAEAMGELDAYLRQIVAERRKAPREDLVSGLVAVEEQGERLTEDELVATCALLLLAGHETTTNLIGNGMLALLEHPDQLALLRREPPLVGSAVEELLRFTPPVHMSARVATEAMEVCGQTVEAGQFVLIGLAAANRDPQVFAEPDRLDITRRENPHVTFGGGIHYCLGAPLARAEGQIALQTLLRAFPEVRLEAFGWKPGLALRGLDRLVLSV